MKFYWFQFFLVITIIGCSSEKEDKKADLITGFPTPVTIDGDRILERETGLLYLKKIDSLLVVSTEADTLIKVYDENENFVSGFGRIGRGPNEFSSPPFISEGIIKGDKKYIFAYNSQLNKLNVIDLNKTIKSNKIVSLKEYEFPSDLMGVSNIFYVNEDTLMGMYSDHFYKKLDGKKGGFYYFPKTKKFETFELTNLTIDPFSTIDESNLNARFPILSRDRKTFALLMRYAPIFEILDVGSKSVNTFYIESYPETYVYSLEAYRDFELTNYYDFAYSGEKYIYILYKGKPFSLEPKKSKIQVLDWDRNPIAEYIVPKEYGLSLFAVDEDKKVLYGLSYRNDAIYRFYYGDADER
ncbi:MAG: hypothetical protein FH748_10135 [Balneolaceae bacterium]|nr:hypothetical protein [Balneolaceae bacterium]